MQTQHTLQGSDSGNITREVRLTGSMLFLEAASQRSRQNSCSDLELLLELTVCSRCTSKLPGVQLIETTINECGHQHKQHRAEFYADMGLVRLAYRDFLFVTLCLLVALQFLMCSCLNRVWAVSQPAKRHWSCTVNVGIILHRMCLPCKDSTAA